MRINYGLVALEVIAIFASYLILFMPISFATDINIHFGTWTQATSIDPNDDVLRSVAQNGAEESFTVSMKNATRQISQVLVYKCMETDPATCVTTVTPEAFTGSMEKSYNWDEIADTASPLPQIGYLIVLVGLEGATSTWYGFRYRLRKTSYGFDPVYNWDINNIDVYAQTSDMASKIRSFIDSNGMIPFNPAWTSRVLINDPATETVELLSDNPATGFATRTDNDNEITGIPNTYSFASPVIYSEHYNPVTLYLNPSFNCGDSNCESGLGETPTNCCIDCPCAATDHYCDVGTNACRNEIMIQLELVGKQQTGITNCYQEHTINVHAKVNSAPSGMTINGQYYMLGAQPAQQTTCIESDGVYDCPITVPADPSCGGYDYVLGPNVLTFLIGYLNGTVQKERAISVSFPDITVGSWTCGDGTCDSTLNEHEGNCCYDCPCTGDNEYCDYAGNYDLVQCRQEPNDDDLQIIYGADPTYFYTQLSSGNTINFDTQIQSMPAGYTTIVPSCSAACVMESGAACSSSCSVICSEIVGGDPGTYEDACSMTLAISSYNATEKYYLYPTMTYALTYNNGSGTASSTLGKDFTTITVDRHWCGDGTCNPDEDSNSCCFDCACPYGQYCDTQNTGQYTPGDMCKSFDAVTVSIVPPYQTDFGDSMFSHLLEIDAYVLNTPPDAVLIPECSFANSDPAIECVVSCSDIDDTGYSLCIIAIPSIDYASSPYFDPANNQLLLDNNALNLSISFSNGSGTVNRLFEFSVPDLTIGVTYHCGMGGCESHLGETPDNCCIDCGCLGANEYCYTGGYLAGECLNADEVYLIYEDTYPTPFVCTIMQMNDECIFTKALGVNANIPNQPDDLEIMASFYEADNVSYNANCVEPDRGNYSCSMVLENIDNPTQGTQVLQGSLGFTVSYTTNGTHTIKNLTAPFTVEVQRNKSDYVKTCEYQIAELDDQIDEFRKNKKVIETILYVLIGLTIGFCIACAYTRNAKLCKACEMGICITSCVAGVLLPMLSSVEAEIESLRDQRQATCATSGFAGLSSSNAASFNSGNIYMGIAASIVCMYCMLTKFGDGSTMQNLGRSGGSPSTKPPPTNLPPRSIKNMA